MSPVDRAKVLRLVAKEMGEEPAHCWSGNGRSSATVCGLNVHLYASGHFVVRNLATGGGRGRYRRTGRGWHAWAATDIAKAIRQARSYTGIPRAVT